MLYIKITLLAVAFGIAWNKYLTARFELFDFWATFVTKNIKSPKVRKLLYACAKCVSGQFALWVGLVYPLVYSAYIWEYHFSSVIFSIFLAGIIDQYVQE